MSMRPYNWLGICLGQVLLLACVTSPLGRPQLALISDQEANAMGEAAFEKIKQDTPQVEDPKVVHYVRCVGNDILTAMRDPATRGSWEIVVFDQDMVNAFALPGRKVGVFVGLLSVAQGQDQLAAVMGHEIAHVLAQHPRERLSTAYAAQTGLQAAKVLSGGSSAAQQKLLGVLGLGAVVGVEMPFARQQESEADLMGMDLMAQAGFDPRASIDLWRNMQAVGGRRSPEFLSTHPSGTTRIRELEARLPRTLQAYEAARSAGRRPACRTPF